MSDQNIAVKYGNNVSKKKGVVSKQLFENVLIRGRHYLTTKKKRKRMKPTLIDRQKATFAITTASALVIFCFSVFFNRFLLDNILTKEKLLMIYFKRLHTRQNRICFFGLTVSFINLMILSVKSQSCRKKEQILTCFVFFLSLVFLFSKIPRNLHDR